MWRFVNSNILVISKNWHSMQSKQFSRKLYFKFKKILTANCNVSQWSVTQSAALSVSPGTHVVASLTAVRHRGALRVVGVLGAAAPGEGVDAGGGGGAKLTLDRHFALGVRPSGAVVVAVTVQRWPGWDCSYCCCYSSCCCSFSLSRLGIQRN